MWSPWAPIGSPKGTLVHLSIQSPSREIVVGKQIPDVAGGWGVSSHKLWHCKAQSLFIQMLNESLYVCVCVREGLMSLTPRRAGERRWRFIRLWGGFPGGSSGKEPACNSGATGDSGSIPGSGRSPGGGNGNPLWYSCLKSPMDRGAWWATGHGVAKSRTWPSDWADLSCFPTSGWIWITQVLGWGTPTLRILILQIWGETWGSAFLTHDANAAGLRTKPWEPEC